MDDSLFELEISSFAFGGMAVGRLDSGKVCFVRGAAPGERVVAKTLADKPSHRFATLVSILKQSPRRIETRCPLAPALDAEGLGESRQCPGCSYRHVPYEDELAAKSAQLEHFVSRWLKLDPKHIIQKPFPAPSRDGWRNKITLGCEATPAGVRAGYKASDNQTLLPLDCCPLAHPAIQALMSEKLSDPSFAASLREGMRLTFRHTDINGALCWTDDPASLESAPELLNETLPQGSMIVPRESFFQVNPAVAAALLKEYSKAVKAFQPALLLDMYCGSGLFSLVGSIAGAAQVEGIEIDAAAIEAAKLNAANAGIRNCRFTAGDAAKKLKQVLRNIPAEGTMLVLDPPRGGLSRNALKEAISLKAGGVVCVSCSADALARDLQGFLAAGYRLRSLKIFDMFPSTAHFETFALLDLPR